MPETPQYLIVVRRWETALFQNLRANVNPGSAPVQVIWDRRTRDRRVIIQDVSLERRRRERRAAPEETWKTAGFVVARTSALASPSAPPANFGVQALDASWTDESSPSAAMPGAAATSCTGCSGTGIVSFAGRLERCPACDGEGARRAPLTPAWDRAQPA